MSIFNATNDIRKLKRSLKLRGEADPELVASTLEAILKESIAVRAMDSGAVGRSATKEIKDIRNALVARQIDAGTRNGEFVGKFSAVLSQLDNIDQDLKNQRSDSSVLSQGFGALKNSIPTADTIASALMTANPIMGYGFKFLNDLRKGNNKRKVQNQSEVRKRLALLKDQEKAISQEMAASQAKISNEKEIANKEKGTRKQRRGIYQDSLDSISDEIAELRRQLSLSRDDSGEIFDSIKDVNGVHSTDNEDQVIQIDESKITEGLIPVLEKIEDPEGSDEIDSKLEKVDESIEESNTLLQKVVDGQESAAKEARKDKDTNSLLNRENEFEKHNSKGLAMGGNNGHTGNGFSLGLPLLGGGLVAGGGILAGLLGGALALTRKIFAPFVGLLKFVTKGASILSRFARVGIITTALFSIYDFFDGFLNASEIIGENANDVDWKERAKVGVANIMSGLLSPIDMIAEWFGGDVYEGSRKDFTKRIYEEYNKLEDKVIDSVKNLYKTIVDSVSEFVDDIKTRISDFIDEGLSNFVPDWAKDIFGMGDGPQEVIPGRGRNKSNPLFNDYYSQPEGSYLMPSSEDGTTSANNQLSANVANDRTSNVNNVNNSGNSVMAPVSNSTTVNNNSYGGTGGTSNEDPTHRRAHYKARGISFR